MASVVRVREAAVGEVDAGAQNAQHGLGGTRRQGRQSTRLDDALGLLELAQVDKRSSQGEQRLGTAGIQSQSGAMPGGVLQEP